MLFPSLLAGGHGHLLGLHSGHNHQYVHGLGLHAHHECDPHGHVGDVRLPGPG